jgi:hypothetical protein
MNRDICLVPEATGIIRAHIDTHNLEACYAKRVDVQTEGLLGFNDIKSIPEYEGIDLFVFRPNASCIPALLEAPLLLGRVAWDNFWADKVKNKLPYNIYYHLPHGSEWTSSKGHDGNEENYRVIHNYSTPDTMGVEHYEGYFKDVK